MPSPNQVSSNPACINNGTSVPEAAIPRPTPVKIAPLASPRRDGGICGRTSGAANAINAPPATPDPTRQAKYHQKESGKAHAKNATVAIAIIARKIGAAPAVAAIRRASTAPARYPAKFAAPRYAVDDAEYQWAAIKAGISRVYAKRASPIPTRFAHEPAAIVRQCAMLSVDGMTCTISRSSLRSRRLGRRMPLKSSNERI